jgi:ubiquinone/menaquinone biosynthesis C-methylase UbiE
MHRLAPFLAGPEMIDAQFLAERLNARYDNSMYSPLVQEYFDYSGFHNYGYWYPRTSSQREASENLVDLLVEFLSDKRGTILDVACGMGASTKRLLRTYAPSDITGINISEKQLATCRTRAPGCRFLNMDATELRFADDSIGNILCVEAAFHFDTREKFLREVYRVLKPGGCLALSDILLRSQRSAFLMADRMPLANFVPDVKQYRRLYDRCGFEDVRIVEAQAQCWEGCRDHYLAFVLSKALAGDVPWAVLREVAIGLRFRDWLFSNYLLVSAYKPQRFITERTARRRATMLMRHPRHKVKRNANGGRMMGSRGQTSGRSCRFLGETNGYRAPGSEWQRPNAPGSTFGDFKPEPNTSGSSCVTELLC